MRELYVTDKYEIYIIGKDEAISYSLDENKNCYQFRLVPEVLEV